VAPNKESGVVIALFCGIFASGNSSLYNEYMNKDTSKPSRPPLSGEALLREIRICIGKHLDLAKYQVFIFGSEAAKKASAGSDVDVGILGPEPLSGAVLDKIRTELESLRTLRQFDLVDFSRVDNSFKAVALQTIKMLNE
jgi:predicted nucleotidyltransferase